MQVIPLSAVPAQTLTVALSGQQCVITLYTKSVGMFMDMTLAGQQILGAQICRDRVSLVRYRYLGFVGTLAFVDTQGTSDPQYSGLGTRWILTYQ